MANDAGRIGPNRATRAAGVVPIFRSGRVWIDLWWTLRIPQRILRINTQISKAQTPSNHAIISWTQISQLFKNINFLRKSENFRIQLNLVLASQSIISYNRERTLET
jgi:hypothetical protein